MSFSRIMKILSYVAGTATVVITSLATGGVAVPIWAAAIAGGVATVSGNLAASHLDSVNEAAAVAAQAKREDVTKS